VGLLAEHFLTGICEQEGQMRRFTPAALAQLATYRWPGNVRELRNAVHRAYVMARGELIDPSWLPPCVGAGTGAVASRERTDALPGPAPEAPAAALALAPPPASGAESITLPIGTSMAQAERLLMLATLRHYNHQKERTAATLGISLKTLYNRLKEYATGVDDSTGATLRD
jgi:DNA-binding NtrC family response regulator